jgi:ribonuclease III
MNLLKPLTDLLGIIRGLGKGKTHGTGSLEELQDVIRYRFRQLPLLKLSLTHKSATCAEDPKGLLSNERLEFLGDAVINCLVTEHLYLLHPDRSEGQLSKIKSLIVSRKILGEIALGIDLGKYMVLGLSEEKSGGRWRMSTLSNAFEAVVGAIYLDGGLVPSKDLLEQFLFGRISEFLRDESNINYKSQILEMSQHDGFGIPRYVTIATSGPDHAKEFHIRIEIAGVPMGEGSGSNKKIAQQNAAMNASFNYDREQILSRSRGDKKNEMVSN